MTRLRPQTVLANELPSIQKMELSDEQITSYLSDLFSAASGIVIRVKDSAQADFRQVDRLSHLHVQLLNKHIWGAELEYDYAGEQWVDSIFVHQQTVRLSRKLQPTVLSA